MDFIIEIGINFYITIGRNIAINLYSVKPSLWLKPSNTPNATVNVQSTKINLQNKLINKWNSISFTCNAFLF